MLSSSVQVYGIPVFSCNFENETWCGMQNGAWYDPELPLYNFTIVTGQTVPDKDLAPATDYTYNSSSGHFLYWHRPSNAIHTSMDGRVSTPMFEQREHMCLNFAYYVKSSQSVSNGTYLMVYLKGCYSITLWAMHTDDTQGWETAVVPLLDETCNVTIRFDVSPYIFSAVSVALDDIVVDICARYITTTTAVSAGNSARFESTTWLVVALFVILMATV
jgi:hypothetical protein